MRKLTDHKLAGLNEAIQIAVMDEPGPGGACHEYHIDINNTGPQKNPDHYVIHFQNGPLGENPPNGISGEALIAIVIDRLRCFQAGEFKCRENAVALTHLEESMMWLQKRTRDRLARGVEGTNQK